MKTAGPIVRYGCWPAALAALPLVAGCASAQVPGPAHAPRAETVDALLSAYRGDVPGASVGVIHDGAVVFRRAYGLSDLEARTPATPETNYRLASLTKQLTATAILLLVEEGKLRYDDRIVDRLPGLPPALREVRIRHLLSHTSGIWDYEAFVPPDQREQLKDRDVPRLVARAEQTHFPPGTRSRYSNSAYAMLALVVERASGLGFARFLHDRIFAPLVMHATVAYEAGVSTVLRRALGYAPEGGGFRPRDQSPTSAVLGDGGVYSSVADLVAWDRALDAHTLVSATAQKLAWTPAALEGGASSYGFGWFIDRDEGRTRLSHHGETCGFTNAILKYPEQRLTVILLTNRAGGQPWVLAQRIADLWLPPRAAAAPPWPCDTLPNAR